MMGRTNHWYKYIADQYARRNKVIHSWILIKNGKISDYFCHDLCQEQTMSKSMFYKNV